VCLALLQSACRHETLAQLALKSLRALLPEATLSDRLSLQDRVSKETDARDKCLKAMELSPHAGVDSDPRASFGKAFRAAFSTPTPPAEPGQ
jgi:hypothetical protein